MTPEKIERMKREARSGDWEVALRLVTWGRRRGDKGLVDSVLARYKLHNMLRECKKCRGSGCPDCEGLGSMRLAEFRPPDVRVGGWKVRSKPVLVEFPWDAAEFLAERKEVAIKRRMGDLLEDIRTTGGTET